MEAGSCAPAAVLRRWQRENQPREELWSPLQEPTLRIRENFGLYGKVYMRTGVTHERLPRTIWTRKPPEGARLPENVRNAVLNWLKHKLSFKRFFSVCDNPELGTLGAPHELPYAWELHKAGTLGRSETLDPRIRFDQPTSV